MHSATGQYSTHAGEPAHPVHISLITATMCGLRFRRVVVPSEIGSYFATSPFTNGATSGVMSATRPPETLLLVSFSSDRAGKSIADEGWLVRYHGRSACASSQMRWNT